ncbi:MAG: urea carboxylase, partial [Gammaproteobacteria bacterium]|nr:urea carboxylase [Gammaproteobacteria bacterium]
FGDGQGKVISLGERDCSAQRRNQKVIEETPAPNIDDNVRAQMQETAKRLCASVHYRSAGTVEYVYDPSNEKFYFLEVNTRLQVEHGVTEQIYDVDLVKWMIQLGANELTDLDKVESSLKSQHHSIQVRLYAEDPNKNFQPNTGLLSQVQFPEQGQHLRIDHWIEAGLIISPNYDPMLAKVIVTEETREQALDRLIQVLAETKIYGIETNQEFLIKVLSQEVFQQGKIYTAYLNDFSYQAATIDIISAGIQTSIQDYPGRIGYWDVGVPPSGPFDHLSFRLGNQLLVNSEECAGLEITMSGPIIKFNQSTEIVLTGAEIEATLDGIEQPLWSIISIHAGQTLKLGKVKEHGARSYCLFKSGLSCPDYLGSKSTFSLGQFGGHAGRILRSGDVLKLNQDIISEPPVSNSSKVLDTQLIPKINKDWQIHVIYGPHGAPDFFNSDYIQQFFESFWEVHYNSSRTGVRLIGPKPDWARTDGGEAGMHPSNIHDNAYAIGAIDFTGDMPVILGPDGPSLGGFVCPACVIQADLWKLGQLKAGDKIQFIPVSHDTAVVLEKSQNDNIKQLKKTSIAVEKYLPESTIIKAIHHKQQNIEVNYRLCGDHYLLVEYGEMILDINLRFRVHALMDWIHDNQKTGIKELTPGIRSLQIHYDSQQLSLKELLSFLESAENELMDLKDYQVESRIVHLPLSWNDSACQLAIEKYMQSVRKDAPWCPSNLEFIRRINGLNSIDEVKKIVFDASYVVMGLGDVYLGAPVATPLDPRHRLVTTKYNPARTWTAENSVGIGGSYLCVYGMEGPGGYQFVGRTLQMWNRYHQTPEFTKPWLLRFFDQIRFYEVSEDELLQIRKDFPRGKYSIKIEKNTFSLRDYNNFLENNNSQIQEFTEKRQQAFDSELQRWIESGQINYKSEQQLSQDDTLEEVLQDNEIALESHISGNLCEVLVKPGDKIETGQSIAIIESMKMETELLSIETGIVKSIVKSVGSIVSAGQAILIMEVES